MAATCAFVIALTAGVATATEHSRTGAQARPAAVPKECVKAFVNGRRSCLRKGDRCKKAYQADYVSAGFSCKRGRLRKASIAQLRGEQPLLLSDNGYLSLRTALAAFDELIAPLPGVEAKPGEIGELTDATVVIERIEADIAKLDPKQRAVFAQWTTPASDALIVDPENPARTLANGRRAPPSGEELILADLYLDDALRVYRRRGFYPPRRLSLTLLSDQGTTKPNVLGYVTSADLPPGTAPYCNVFVTQKGRGLGAIDKRLVLAHEAAHCLQHAFVASKADLARVPAWVTEGTAEWLSAKAIEELGVGTPTQVAWTGWLKEPARDLFTRSYDAIGFYSMLEQAGVDTWSRVKGVISGAVAGASPGAYAAAIAGAPDIFNSRWGPGLVRDLALGPEWDYSGPFIDPSNVKTVTIANGALRTSTIAARSSAAVKFAISADVVTVKADKDVRGLLRFEGEQRALKRGAYCAKPGGCRCTTRTNLQLPRIGKTTWFGYGDPQKARTVTFQGRTLKDYCKMPRPGPAPCRAGRRQDSLCPVPAAGIQIFNDPDSQVPVASFKIGDCTVGPGGFTAISTDGAWRLEVGISSFGGFGDYLILYGGPDPEVVIDGPGGPFGNLLWSPGGLPLAGAISFQDDGRQMGLGFIEFRDASASEPGIAGAGGMTCVYPDD